jgi:N-acetylglucosaminyldiphosphoundecaprenol N-acetyl-beta-D-mannosaminyltransferase
MDLPRVNILGVGVSAATFARSAGELEGWIRARRRFYVNVCTVNTVMECQRSEILRAIVNGAAMVTTDGMPLVWLARRLGHSEAERVYGPDLMLELCRRGREHGWRHFFYGGQPGVADELARRLTAKYPGLQVAGTHSPPWRPVGAIEEAEVLARIESTSPDVVWIGLGTPKQDFWAVSHRPLLSAPALMPVGAAFDFHAGRVPQAPRWVQRAGLEWLYRLGREPRRLGPRYLADNPAFIWLVLLQLLRLRAPLPPSPGSGTQPPG